MPPGNRRGRAIKTHSSSASTLNTVHTDKVKDSSKLAFSVLKGAPFSFAETAVQQSLANMSPNNRGDPRPVPDAEKLMVEWNDFMAGNLEEILLENLSDIFAKAIRQIVACGYSEKDAKLAVLKSGLYYGIMNPMLNIVNGALIFLEMAEEFGTSKYHIFDNLGNLVKYLMLEMVYVLKEAKPSLTVAEAMWGLMVCKMDLAEAYAVDGGTLRSYCTIGHELCESLFSHPKYAYLFQDSQPSTSSDQQEPESDSPHSMPSFRRVSYTENETSNSDPSSGGNSSGECFHDIGEMFFIEEQCWSIKRCSGASKRDMLRQKPYHLERYDKGYMSSTIKARVSPWGALVLDQRLKDLNSVNSYTKRTCSESSVAGDNLPAATVPETSYTVTLPVEDFVSALPAARPKVNSPASPEPSDIRIGIPYYESSGKYVPRDEKDRMIQSQASRLLMLKKEHQRLTNWANEKVMQAAQRLRKDQAELKALRQMKEVVEKREKDKLYIREEDAIKRISELEYAVAGFDSHMKLASERTSKIEEINFVLKKELEAAKLQTLESAANLHGALMREQKTLKMAQSWEGKKTLLREELSADKRKVAELQIALEKAKGLYRQIEALCKQEEKEKEKLLAEASSIAREREHGESLAQTEELAIKQNAETELQKGKVHIKLLESKLFESSPKSEYSKLSQVRRNLKGRSGSYPSEDVYAKVRARMERECVMCMSEEKSVVFLPCAHQSLCARCNKLHEKQGMKDCPSCRTPIERRISVRFANP